MEKILIAIDFSESCTNAISFVNGLIKGSSIQVDMVHVYSVPVASLTSMSTKVAEELIEGNKKHIKELMLEQMQLVPLDNRGELHPVYGIYASSDIVDVANSVKADLIVMALRQKYSMIDRLMGTVTAHTISKSSVPVLAIPNGCSYKDTCNVLFPTEAPYSSSLTKSLDSQLQSLFDYCKNYESAKINMVHINQGDGVDIIYKHNAIRNLEFIVSNAKSVEEGIKNILSKYAIDLIAIQKKSRSFWERLYHSSVTRKLLYHAKLPILILS